MASPLAGERIVNVGGVKSYCMPGIKTAFASFPALSLALTEMV